MKFGDTVRLQFRAEVFDIFNHANFGQPGNVVGTLRLGESRTPASRQANRFVTTDTVCNETPHLERSCDSPQPHQVEKLTPLAGYPYSTSKAIDTVSDGASF